MPVPRIHARCNAAAITALRFVPWKVEWYEGVTREQVLEVLRHAEQSLAAA